MNSTLNTAKEIMLFFFPLKLKATKFREAPIMNFQFEKQMKIGYLIYWMQIDIPGNEAI